MEGICIIDTPKQLKLFVLYGIELVFKYALNLYLNISVGTWNFCPQKSLSCQSPVSG